MDNRIKWGIIGLGKIANKFAEDLKLSENAILYGVASRNRDKARSFGERHGAIMHFDSYRGLAEHPEIDVVYVATPHSFHFENTMMCLENNKAVLCEKPMGMDSVEVGKMIEEAKSRKLFLMEGLWTRFIPATEKLLELLEEKAIGDVIAVRADFGFKGDLNLESRVYDKALGGGSLLDIGIYPIYLSLLILGVPTDMKVMARMAETDVDSHCTMLFDYGNSEKAILESTIEADTPTEAYIYGSKGRIRLHSRFHHTREITLTRDEEEKTFDIGYVGNGYFHEIEEVNGCLLAGETESRKLPLGTSSNLMTLIDRVKEKIGLRYDN